MNKTFASVILSAICSLSACVPSAEEALSDESQSVIWEQEQELSTISNSTYFVVTHMDARRCAYPMCGGYFTARVNQKTTTCSDGSVQPECRILEFDYSALKLDAASATKLSDLVHKGEVLLRGTIKKTAPIAGQTYDKLVVSEAWMARAHVAASGSFVRSTELAVTCTTCTKFGHAALNKGSTVRSHSVAFDPASFAPALVTELQSAMKKPEGILTAGTLSTVAARQVFSVSEAYTPFVASGPRVGKLGDSCGSRGIPLECETGLFCQRPDTAMCGRADAPGTCQKKPEVCTTLYMPVCGCDGTTYSNRCVAYGNGVSVDYEGACKAP